MSDKNNLAEYIDKIHKLSEKLNYSERLLGVKDAEIKELESRISEIAVNGCKGYPEIEAQTAFGALWAIEQTLEGVKLANNDLHIIIANQKDEIKELKRLNKDISQRECYQRGFAAGVRSKDELFIEMDEYLNHGHGTSIGCGSIFHQQIKSAIANK